MATARPTATRTPIASRWGLSHNAAKTESGESLMAAALTEYK